MTYTHFTDKRKNNNNELLKTSWIKNIIYLITLSVIKIRGTRAVIANMKFSNAPFTNLRCVFSAQTQTDRKSSISSPLFQSQ